jgi:predicted amidohydrolase YtcJ
VSEYTDLVVTGGDVVTMNARRTILLDAAIVAANGTIIEVGDRAEAVARSPRRSCDRRSAPRGHTGLCERSPAPDG